MIEPPPPPPSVATVDSWNPGDVVRVAGLNGRVDLNGQRAEVLHWDSDSRRFAISMASSGERVKVKEENLIELERLLVTVISGLSETGKTALVQHALNAGRQEGLRVGLLVNDARAEAQQTSQSPSSVSEGLKLVGGCICCNFRAQFAAEVTKLARTGMFDYLVVEASDHAEPRQIAENFCAGSNEDASSNSSATARKARRRQGPSKGLGACAELDTMVSVLDGTAIINYLQDNSSGSGDSQASKEDAIAQLMVHQVEFGDMIIVSKSELLTEAQLRDVKSFLSMMNPEAGCMFAKPSDVPTYELLGRGAYMWQQLQVRQPTRKWLEQSAAGFTGMSSAFSSVGCVSPCCALPGEDAQGDAAGVSSFTFRPARPFHPARLVALANGNLSLPPSVLRVTGTCWLASRCARRGIWSTKRRGLTEITMGAPWWVGVPRTKWPDTLPSQLIEKGLLSPEGRWHDEQYGDCHSELSVVAGQGFRSDVLEVYLTELLVTEEEFAMGPTGWVSFQDPLPAWNFQLDVDTLYCLALIGAEGMLEALCLQGADVNAQNSINSGSALHAACLKGRTRSVKLLLDHRADSGLAAQRDLTPLHLSSSPQVVELLCQHRCDLEPKDSKGQTPLHHAATLARASVVSALLSCRADVNTMTNTLETPLHLAAASGDAAALEVVKVLSAADADLALVSGVSGLDALGIARKIGARDMTEFLLECSLQLGQID